MLILCPPGRVLLITVRRPPRVAASRPTGPSDRALTLRAANRGPSQCESPIQRSRWRRRRPSIVHSAGRRRLPRPASRPRTMPTGDAGDVGRSGIRRGSPRNRAGPGQADTVRERDVDRRARCVGRMHRARLKKRPGLCPRPLSDSGLGRDLTGSDLCGNRQEEDGNRSQNEQESSRNPQQSEIVHVLVLVRVMVGAEGGELRRA